MDSKSIRVDAVKVAEEKHLRAPSMDAKRKHISQQVVHLVDDPAHLLSGGGVPSKDSFKYQST